ncbi:phage tail protein [Castellaniella sp. S9]|uniref:phage tail protein n=1 Tax=Castellaniella sp. S9 TaxID=2993652 RepID=UPI0022B45A68|nr:phage tail protein [Castellaniella sp. S9]
MINLVKGLGNLPLAQISTRATQNGYPATGAALRSGRIDNMVGIAGAGAIDMLAQTGIDASAIGMSTLIGTLVGTLLSVGSGDPPPAGEVLLILGAFPFMVGTAAYQTIKRSHEYRWATQARLMRAPAKQFVGVGNEQIDLDGYLLPHYTGGGGSMDILRAQAARGEPMDLVDHFGLIYGQYVIEHIEETSSEVDVRGTPRRIDFRISISAYGPDAPRLSLDAAVSAMQGD